jgi:hypothetical protein
LILTTEGGETVIQTGVHKKNELDYFFVEESYGGNQDLFPEISMRDGGCGAVAACESCIYFARRADKKKLYPHKLEEITWEEYHDFAYIMKHYLCPRPNGIDTLELYMEGFGEYLKDVHEENLMMEAFHGTHAYEEAREAVMRQIDSDSPIPYLMLKHQNKNGHLEDYIWHWFILAGYEETEDDLMVKAVSYGEYKWFSLKELWDTGYDKKGGMILYHIK